MFTGFLCPVCGLGQLDFEGRWGQVFGIAQVGLHRVGPAEADAGQALAGGLDQDGFAFDFGFGLYPLAAL